MKEGVCKLCSCTKETPCINEHGQPCAWADEAHTLCTACVGENQGEIAGCEVYSPGTYVAGELRPLSPIHRAVLGQVVEEQPGTGLYLPFGSGSK